MGLKKLHLNSKSQQSKWWEVMKGNKFMVDRSSTICEDLQLTWLTLSLRRPPSGLQGE